MKENKNRIEWIDLAKGICISLVVLHHATVSVGYSFSFEDALLSFRMPLYFILSGLFFKQYEGFVGFLKRKMNKLFIPFTFFLITTSVIPFWIIHQANSLEYFFNDHNGPVYNFPIWFLLCLFEINILFYLIQMVTRLTVNHYQIFGIILLSSICGCIGLALAANEIRIPLYIGSSLTAIPFFAFGWWLRKYTSFLSSPINLKLDIPIIAACLLILHFFATHVIYSANSITREGLFTVHLCGIAGTLMVLTLSKIVGQLPFISYWGRYSIMILCSHQLVVLALSYLLVRVMPKGWVMAIIVFIGTLITCHFLIAFMKKYMPHVTAQKDIIKI